MEIFSFFQRRRPLSQLLPESSWYQLISSSKMRAAPPVHLSQFHMCSSGWAWGDSARSCHRRVTVFWMCWLRQELSSSQEVAEMQERQFRAGRHTICCPSDTLSTQSSGQKKSSQYFCHLKHVIYSESFTECPTVAAYLSCTTEGRMGGKLLQLLFTQMSVCSKKKKRLNSNEDKLARQLNESVIKAQGEKWQDTFCQADNLYIPQDNVYCPISGWQQWLTRAVSQAGKLHPTPSLFIKTWKGCDRKMKLHCSAAETNGFANERFSLFLSNRNHLACV